MHLKTLTMKGFKSFASATTMSLEPGITCVVGPNGSGKSNVVDALAWVMGEQGVKTLRGGAMADVIFAGTTSRPPLGRAEVTLTIDNADGTLPIEYSEVTISRTLFRSGGSEYAINGAQCRLLDIQELLSDVGLGREMHVVVGQGQLDSVLRATPEDRRGFIEEAAGVLKHRKRKEKALRKLDQMAGNLARLTDLTGELRRQLGPLGRQADAAKRARIVQAEVRDARSRLLADDVSQLEARLEADHASDAVVRQRQEETETALNKARSALAHLEVSAATALREATSSSDMYHTLIAQRERLRAVASVAEERVRTLGVVEAEQFGTDPDALDAQSAKVALQEADLAQEVDAASRAVDAATQDRVAQEDAAHRAEKALADLQRTAADWREALARLTGRAEAKRSRVEAAEAEERRLRDAIAQAQERERDAAKKFALLEQDVVGAESGEMGLDADHEAAVEALEEAHMALGEAEAIITAAEHERATHTARAEALELSLDRKDGSGALAEQAASLGVTGSVASVLGVETGFEDAITAALGPLADALVVQSVDAAVDSLRYLRDQDAGRATLLVSGEGDSGVGSDAMLDESARSDSAPDEAVPGDTVRSHSMPDEYVPATSVIHTAGPAAAAIQAVLRTTVIAEDLAQARALVATHPHLTAVTRSGDHLSAIHAAGGSTAEPSVIHIQAALDAARASAAQAAATTERTRFTLPGLREAVDAATARHQETLERLHASDAALAAVAEQLGTLGAAQRAGAAEAERHTTTLDAVVEARQRDEQELAALSAELDQARSAPAQAPESNAAAVQERDTAQQAATHARARETEARLALRTAQERHRAVAGRAQSLARAARTERESRQRAAERAAQRSRRATEAASVLAEATTALTAIARSIDRAATARDHAAEAGSEFSERLTSTRTQADSLAEQLRDLTDVAHRDEVARAQHTALLHQLHQRALEELGLAPEALINEYGPHLPVPVIAPRRGSASSQASASGQASASSTAAASGTSPSSSEITDEPPVRTIPYVREEQEARLTKAERALARIGTINPLALEEFAALEERHQYLTEQVEDIKRSRHDLLGIVDGIDQRVQQVFMEAFADTAEQFQQVFPVLFPGGEGRLILTDPDSPLTTGIEVEARPAGKKVKRLSLLSGGERSLTALAFLVSIFTARPSPFLILDEVEAALDDVNLSRLLDVFRALQQQSQLIIITHQKRTMEIADALYGVAMRAGITTLISQRLTAET
ncbi:MAG: chromosome segregation protein SMC [Cellulomonadaceae bacterium]|nr:chromosome segregation protein SMC [Cellulomonadaceae bacterium]